MFTVRRFLLLAFANNSAYFLVFCHSKTMFWVFGLYKINNDNLRKMPTLLSSTKSS